MLTFLTMIYQTVDKKYKKSIYNSLTHKHTLNKKLFQ